jgi:2,5-diketo-D-gluconate reductase B
MSNGDEFVEVRGVRVPALGFGTWLVTGQDATDGVREALEIGYRQIDTARAYENEREVGRGIAESGIPRDQIFLTTKVPHDDATADGVERDAEQSLELLRQALEIAPVFCNQVEYHPFLDQSALLDLARANEVLITAYSPLAHGKVPGDETLRSIGARHGKTPGQVALRWLLDQPGVSPIPKASSRERRQENFDVFDFALTDEDRGQIEQLPKHVRTANPPWAPD